MSDAECPSVFEGTIPTSSASGVGRNFERRQNQRHGDGRKRLEVVLAPTPDAFASSRMRGDGQQTEVGGQVRNVRAG